KAAGPKRTGGLLKNCLAKLLGCVDENELSHAAAVFEFHHARDLREEGIVFAPADIRTRLDLGAALPHDDRTARNQLSAEHFHAQPLRVGIAPVFRTA